MPCLILSLLSPCILSYPILPYLASALLRQLASASGDFGYGSGTLQSSSNESDHEKNESATSETGGGAGGGGGGGSGGGGGGGGSGVSVYKGVVGEYKSPSTTGYYKSHPYRLLFISLSCNSLHWTIFLLSNCFWGFYRA